jgi:very-short-patch-repair endonuclease
MENRHRIHPAILKRSRELRHPQTPAETTLWRLLRDRKLGYKFRRQHPIDRFIVDFYCAEARLCTEIDGASHLDPDQAEYDAARTAYLIELGYHVIRFTNKDVCYNVRSVVEEITRSMKDQTNSLKLIDVLDNIDQFDDDSVIFIPKDSKPDEDTQAMVRKIIVIDESSGIQTPERMKYLLEVELAKEVIQVWRDWRNGEEPSPSQKYQAVLYYAENDAYISD